MDTKRRYLHPNEISDLLKACKHVRNPSQAKLILTLLYHHGLRVSELIALEWRDIDYQNSSIFIRRAKGSNSGTHSINGEELRLLKRESGKTLGRYIVYKQSNPNLPITRVTVNRLLELLSEVAGIEFKVTPHMLRHSCGYYLANKGVPLREIQDYLGHKNIQNTVHYTMLNANRSRHYFE